MRLWVPLRPPWDPTGATLATGLQDMGTVGKGDITLVVTGQAGARLGYRERGLTHCMGQGGKRFGRGALPIPPKGALRWCGRLGLEG